MLNKQAIEGLLKATPEKRYHSFLNTVADREEIWGLIAADQETWVTDEDGCVLLWPYREFCERMMASNEHPEAIEVHVFLEQWKARGDSIGFSVFPTDENTHVVSAERLCLDIQEYLDEIE